MTFWALALHRDFAIRLRRWRFERWPFVPANDEGSTLKTSVSLSLHGGNLILMIPNFGVSLPHRCGTTVSLETKHSFVWIHFNPKFILTYNICVSLPLAVYNWSLNQQWTYFATFSYHNFTAVHNKQGKKFEIFANLSFPLRAAWWRQLNPRLFFTDKSIPRKWTSSSTISVKSLAMASCRTVSPNESCKNIFTKKELP